MRNLEYFLALFISELSMRRFFDSLMKESLLDIFNNITCEFTLLFTI